MEETNALEQSSPLESETFKKIVLSSAPAIAAATASTLTGGNTIASAVASGAVNYACREHPEAVVTAGQTGTVVAVGLGVTAATTALSLLAGPVIMLGVIGAITVAAIRDMRDS